MNRNHKKFTHTYYTTSNIADFWANYISINITQERFANKYVLDTSVTVAAPIIPLLMYNTKLGSIGGEEKVIYHLSTSRRCPSSMHFNLNLIHTSIPRGYQVKQWWHGGILTTFTIDLQY